MKSKLFALLAIIMIGLAFSCEKENENLSLAEIHGEVEFDETPFQGATVNLHSGTFATDPFVGFDKQVLTDENGKFDFDNLSKGGFYVFAYLLDGHDTLTANEIIIITTDKGTYEADIHIESDNHVD